MSRNEKNGGRGRRKPINNKEEDRRKPVNNTEEHIKGSEEYMEGRDPFLDGNGIIEEAIARFCGEVNEENLLEVLLSIRTRMREDGHFVFPVEVDDQDGTSFRFRTVQAPDGGIWPVAFTSHEEFEKGEPSEALSNFIDTMLRNCLDMDVNGFVINPWGQSFTLSKELIVMLLTLGMSPLEKAVNAYDMEETEENLRAVLDILAASDVWIPCRAELSDADHAQFERLIEEAESAGGPGSVIGRTVKVQESVRLIPDILERSARLFFPVFEKPEDMGEYGEDFSKVEKPFIEAVRMAETHGLPLSGIVVNAFTEPFVLDIERFDEVKRMCAGERRENGGVM